MKRLHSLLSLGIATLSLLSSLPAQAGILELQVLKTIDAQPESNRCPSKVTVTEDLAPYREGGFTVNGKAKLDTISERFSLASSDDFSAIWVAKLKPAYAKCKATAGITKSKNEPYQGASYLRLRFVGGKIYLILDMTGMSDANHLTPAILKKDVQAGNPTWSWGGTD